ncbi:ABC transporter permease [Spirosoma soli]|uniref:ABC transporter permease n=1 Tax=Spirosoma soli TaxID=1770529 RepID=A0ABW5M8Y1_9BACT
MSKQPIPPRLATRLLRWFCAPHLLDEMEGDLDELFEERVASVGLRRARWRYWRDVLSLMRPQFMKRQATGTPDREYPNPSLITMIRSYLKIALRNQRNNGTFSLLNIGGLATGLVCFTVIALFVNRELRFDQFHHQPEQVYRVVKDFVNDDGTRVPDATTPPPLAPALQKDLPEVANATRLFPSWGNKVLVEYGDKRYYEPDGMAVDSSFFDVFDFAFRSGTKQAAFKNPNSILLTETFARKYFGDTNPIGKTLKVNINDGTLFTVTGVLKDVPANSHFTFSFLMPLTFDGDVSTQWGQYNFYTYVRLRPTADPTAFASKLQPLVNKYVPDNTNQFYTQALTDIHLTSALRWELGTNGDRSYVRILILIAVFIIILAGVNYVNLVTAQSSKRAKEIGVRKASGAPRSSVIRQFLVESVVTAMLAFVLAIAVVAVLLPFTNNLLGSGLSLFSAESRPVWLILVGVVLLVGLLAGLYPALYLSSFEPVKVLKGNFVTSRKGVVLRQGLVVFQFVISITLLAGALVVSRQLTFMQEKKVGFDQENIVVVSNAGGLTNRDALVDEWKKDPAVVNVGEATGVFGKSNWTIGVRAKGKRENLLLNFLVVDYDFLPTMDVALKEGRTFSRQFGTDSTAIVLNEAAVKQLGLTEPVVGRKIAWNSGDGPEADSNYYHVIGVVKDFHFSSFRETIKPFGFVANFKNPGTLFVKVRSADMAQTVAALQRIWTKFVPEKPFEYSFQDEQMAKLHESEARFQHLFSSLTTLAMIIACLGLFGLAIYTAEQRTKEIGVRKVLGASVPSVVALLSKDFLKLVLIAIIIAIPIAWYTMHQWLQGFAYKIDLSWWMFALAGVLAALVALLTVSYQSIKAALMNPVKCLRSE